MEGRRAKIGAVSRDGGFYRAWTIVAMFLMLGAAVLLASCGGEEGAERPAEDVESEGPAAGVTLTDIVESPDDFFGKSVTVSGEVNELVGPQAFTIGGEDFLGTDELLIVGAQQLPNIIEGVPEGEPAEIGEDDIVQVTGTVREFVITDIEEEIGADLDDALFEEFEGQPVVVAEQVFLSPRAERAGPGQPLQATVVEISDNPEEWLGVPVTTTGAVVEVVEPAVFTISDPADAEGLAEEEFGALAEDDAILVVNSTGRAPQPNLSELATVQVTGEVREFDVVEFEQEAGIDLDDGLYTTWGGSPAILAQQIQQTQ